jgi:hypothetical protein
VEIPKIEAAQAAIVRTRRPAFRLHPAALLFPERA